MWNNYIFLPALDEQTQLYHILSTWPWKVILEGPSKYYRFLDQTVGEGNADKGKKALHITGFGLEQSNFWARGWGLQQRQGRGDIEVPFACQSMPHLTVSVYRHNAHADRISSIDNFRAQLTQPSMMYFTHMIRST